MLRDHCQPQISHFRKLQHFTSQFHANITVIQISLATFKHMKIIQMSSTEQPNNTNSSQTTSGGLDSLGGVVAAQTQGVANVALGMALNEQNTKTQVAAEEQKKQNQAAAAEI